MLAVRTEPVMQQLVWLSMGTGLMLWWGYSVNLASNLRTHDIYQCINCIRLGSSECIWLSANKSHTLICECISCSLYMIQKVQALSVLSSSSASVSRPRRTCGLASATANYSLPTVYVNSMMAKYVFSHSPRLVSDLSLEQPQQSQAFPLCNRENYGLQHAH